MRGIYVGLISGTSVDGVDAVLADIDTTTFSLRAAFTTPYPMPLHERVRRLIEHPHTSLRELGAIDHAVGSFFARCAADVVERAGVRPADVTAIGHHGQTVFHEPNGAEPFTMQIGDPNIVAAETGITTVADFRRFDMALGGQGAPLVPAFHAWRFADEGEARVVVNIGGMANITVLEPAHAPRGFDTGPGNALLDLWTRRWRNADYDAAGRWAASGRVDAGLLDALLAEPYFALPPPKSTGRELFHGAWLDARLANAGPLPAADVQATLAELTAATIVTAIHDSVPRCARVIVCGGGAHNADLLARIQRRTRALVETTDAYGLSPDWVEGAAFAWLARARLEKLAGNVPSVTGARRPAVLGGVYWSATP